HEGPAGCRKGKICKADHSGVDNESRCGFGFGRFGRQVRGSMKSKGKKKEELDALKKELADAKNLFVAQFQGMTVAQDTELRQKVRETKSKYRVVKNTLAKKAAEGTAAESVSKSFDGSTAIAYNA